MKKTIKHKSQKEMFSLVKSCLESGISKRDFFKQHGIEEATFYYWYKKYRESIAKSEAKFIPLQLPPTLQCQTEIEISYPNGVSVKLPARIRIIGNQNIY